MMTDQDILDKFPCAAPRRGQLAAIRFILDSFAAGKRFVLLEAPTGSGKSIQAATVSEFVASSYYLTIQKMLQAQLMRDFGAATQLSSPMVELRGRNAYPCTFYDVHGQTAVTGQLMSLALLEQESQRSSDCSAGYCKKHLGKPKCGWCLPPLSLPARELADWRNHHGVDYSTCPYYEQVNKATAAPKVLMNFSSFLHQTQYTKRFGERDLLIIDECHHVETQIMDFVSLSINDLTLRNHGIALPEFEEPIQYAVWFHDHNLEFEIGRMIGRARQDRDVKAEDEATRLLYKYRRFMECINDGMTDWVCEYKERSLGKDKSFATVTFKPIFVRHFVNDLLFRFGTNVLMMSATILDAGVMAKSLGMNKDDIAFFRLGNYFPVANRPIHYQPAAKMVGGKDKMADWGPALVAKVDEIVAKYATERGIIHTHNFAIADLIMAGCKDRGRFLFQRNFKDKDEMLREHGRRSNGVLVAPAMHEGLDLRDDLSRFQIIAKVPYPNFFDDQQLARRVELDRKFLIWLVATKLLQSTGRSVRSDVDWAHTYIIDGAFDRFRKEAHKMLPEWFKEAIVEGANGTSA